MHISTSPPISRITGGSRGVSKPGRNTWDRPALVINAVRAVIEAARAGNALAH
jgi:hypothetical protein